MDELRLRWLDKYGLLLLLLFSFYYKRRRRKKAKRISPVSTTVAIHESMDGWMDGSEYL